MALEQIGLQAILDDRNFQNGLKSYTKGVGEMTKVTDSGASMMTRLGSVMQGALVVGVGAATAAFAGAIAIAKTGLDATLAWAEQLDKLGDQFGMSGEVASGWAFLMNRVGLSVDEGAQGLNYFTNQLGSFGKTMKDGTLQVTPFSDALKKLGINAIDPTTKKVKTFDQLMPEIMDKFEKLPAGIDASALAMDLFGTRGGTKFLDFLRQGGKGLDDAKKKAKEFGLELSTDEVNAAEEFGFAMNELNLEFTGFKNTIGRYVLPIAKELVRWISTNAIPRLIELAKKYMPLIIAGLRQLAAWVTVNVLPQLQRFTDWIRNDAIPFVQRLVEAFKGGGLLGVVRQLATEFQNAWPTISAALAGWGTRFWDWLTSKGGAVEQTGAKVGQLVSGIATWLGNPANQKAIWDALTGWAGRFWGWVTDPSGVVATTGGNLVNIVGAIRDWLNNPANTQPIWDFIGPWVEKFWGWVTDPNKGLLITVATEMGKLAAAIETWTNDPETQKRFAKIGTDLAQYIMDGMGKLFSDQGKGDSLMNRLWRTLLQADRSIWNAMVGIGRDISTAILSGLASFFTDPATAQAFAFSIITMMQNAINAVLAALPGIFKPLSDAWFNFFAGLGGPPAPTTPGIQGGGGGAGGVGGGFQHGGYVPRDMLARLHAGEYVLPAAQVSRVVNNNQRMIGAGAVVINFPAGTTLTRADVEEVTYRAVRRVMDAA